MGIRDMIRFIREDPNYTKDPICGMSVNLRTTKYKSTYQGKVYGFCSAGCKASFDENPSKYAVTN